MKTITTPSIVRRVAAITTLGLGLGGLMATPVSADAPTNITDSYTFTDVNPCTGLDHDITIDVEVSEHQDHKNNFVVTVKRSGTTSDGYVMDRSPESQQWNANTAHITLNDVWENAEGSKFKAHLNVALTPEGPHVEKFSLLCIRA